MKKDQSNFRGTFYRQINNLRIYNFSTGGWFVKTLKRDGNKILEVFAMKHEVEKFCQETYDFLLNRNQQNNQQQII